MLLVGIITKEQDVHTHVYVMKMIENNKLHLALFLDHEIHFRHEKCLLCPLVLVKMSYFKICLLLPIIEGFMTYCNMSILLFNYY
jgi:hypothetical protein